jgi:tRNA (adenine57-N1/adenine58-N1)-methyltransferase
MMLDDVLLPDSYFGLKRGPQVMLAKDIGMVITYTGVGKDSVCVDAGAGSGWLAVSLAKVCKHVTTYDVREDFLEIARKNAKIRKLDNIEFKLGDVSKKIDEKDVDLVTLDMPDSDKAVKNAHGALKEGGHIFGYLPHMEQVKSFVAAMGESGFGNVITLEVIVREILVREQGTRPSTKGVWHTAYLVFGTKEKEK